VMTIEGVVTPLLVLAVEDKVDKAVGKDTT
jgi:hypothetical protein